MTRSSNKFHRNTTTDPNGSSVCDEHWMFTDGNNEKSSTGLPVAVVLAMRVTMATIATTVLCHWKHIPLHTVCRFWPIKRFLQCSNVPALLLMLRRHRTAVCDCIHSAWIRCTFFFTSVHPYKHKINKTWTTMYYTKGKISHDTFLQFHARDIFIHHFQWLFTPCLIQTAAMNIPHVPMHRRSAKFCCIVFKFAGYPTVLTYKWSIYYTYYTAHRGKCDVTLVRCFNCARVCVLIRIFISSMSTPSNKLH